MAKEIKSIDVENAAEELYIKIFQKFGWELKSSQRVFNQSTSPVRAITYEGYTHIESETETVDFTKLVFEREQKIPNYDQLVELENEFWRLSEVVAIGRPNLPPHATTMAGWAKYTEPELRTKIERRLPHILFGLMIATELCAPLALAEIGKIPANENVVQLIFLGIGITALVWKLTTLFLRKNALRSAINSPQSKYRKRLERLYNQVIDQIELYDYSSQRMDEIVNQAARLL